MIGNQPNVNNLDVNLEELVLPVSLLADEELSPDGDPEEEEHYPYTIDTCCKPCGAGVRFTIIATPSAVITLRQLLLQEVFLTCLRCSRSLFRHGRS
ncbi:transforming protein E7 [Human papillomavirus type 60]|uniref:Protein E7 n=1 Tax=Human papillomavirus type 60 TaxID=40540 RepID=VE7_HPV60|nr:transforming protein E7 [Human papillomavirus type 60]Q80942.1 RecName: Full=Protein E7 [Human papillomavirus type 60]AAA79486.1 transforming protein E7 [Human papillomavirus type 60]